MERLFYDRASIAITSSMACAKRASDTAITVLRFIDVYEELEHLVAAGDFDNLGFSEIWLIDDGPKYTLRLDPRAPADFFCFSPAELVGVWGQERKRRPYWSLIQDRFL